ncbi:MAG: mechanosensitive ion channel family protein [Acidimicrobiales bacterium]
MIGPRFHVAFGWQSIDDIEKIEEAITSTPVTGRDLAVAAIILGLSCVVAWLAGRVVRRALRRYTQAPDYVDQLVGWWTRALIVFVGFAASLERLGVDVGWFAVIIAVVGVIVVLMVRPLVENGASALLLTSRPSFGVGDEIETNGHRGEVIAVNTRSTVLQTRDCRRIHIPNSDVLDNPIVVYTAYDVRRSQLEVEVSYHSDVDEVCRLLTQAAADAEGVLDEPAPDTQVRGFGTSTFIVRLRWWHASELRAEANTLDTVARNVKHNLDGAGVDMPSPELIVRQPDLGARAGSA